MNDFSQRQRFDFYVDALNRDDMEGVAACYAPDLHMTDDQVDLRSGEAAMAFHRRFASRLELLNYVDRPGRIAAEIRWTLRAREHPTDPLATGETRTWASFTMIDIADGRFKRIRSAPCRAAP
ncbi:hypothetical protein IP70_18115 [alpha proteobacterium AAP38]|uniref:nuclear transport factor 2 family protein n=1 Tax=Niveispirillum sp. TaxID=1917217 RepID=UPI0006B8B8A3|nr:hypothetical protein IP70_18115 [alpha proteobacterium AAP38]